MSKQLVNEKMTAAFGSSGFWNIPNPDIGADLTADQRAAFDEVLAFLLHGNNDDQWMTLAGPAGTGKTYLMDTVVEALVGHGRHVAVAAPTHKALSVLGEKITVRSGVTLSTVHALVGVRMTEGDDGELVSLYGGVNSVHDYDVLIVDEASMVGSQLFDKIFEDTGACRVLFVGDPAQLPPVLDGDLSPAFDEIQGDQVTLTQIVRQAAGNPIIAASMAVRHCESRMSIRALRDAVSVLPKKQGIGVKLMQVSSTEMVRHAAKRIKAGEDLRVLCYTNMAVLEYNQRIHRLLYGKQDGCQFTPGQRVIAQTAFSGRLVMNQNIMSQVHTSEELTVVSVTEGEWEGNTEIECYELSLVTDDGVQMTVLYPADSRTLNTMVSDVFRQARQFKDKAAAADRPEVAAEHALAARDANAHAWSMKKAFAELRHNFAMTVHKSQGSTFDSVVIDLSDLSRIGEFNRALYTAITRPRHQVLLCLTGDD